MLHMNKQCENVFLFEQLTWICNAGCLKKKIFTLHAGQCLEEQQVCLGIW